MKGVANRALILTGYSTLIITSGYVLHLARKQNLLKIENEGVFTYISFLLLGISGLMRYVYPSSLTSRLYRELCSLSHAVGLFSLAVYSVKLHDVFQIPVLSTLPLPHISLILFISIRFLLGPAIEDALIKLMWGFSTLVIFYTGLKAFHWLEMIGSTFLATSFVTFYFNRVFSENRQLLGVSDLVWYLLMLTLSLGLLGYSFFAQHFD